jgi:hypothetical protein
LIWCAVVVCLLRIFKINENMERLKNEVFLIFEHKKHYSLENTRKALNEYKTNIDEVKTLQSGLPIFLDTNVLLGYYAMAENDKKNFKTFITSYKGTIYITKEILEEFVRNRKGVIDRDKNIFKGFDETFKTSCKKVGEILASFEKSVETELGKRQPKVIEELKCQLKDITDKLCKISVVKDKEPNADVRIRRKIWRLRLLLNCSDLSSNWVVILPLWLAKNALLLTIETIISTCCFTTED